jgi:CO/xanthine dehydrogenase Mo-binding subunit
VPRRDAVGKLRGESDYIDDLRFDNMIYARTVYSTVPRAKITNIRLPELPPGYAVINRSDVPGKNRAKLLKDDWPFLAEDEVMYIGEPVLLITGPDRATLDNLTAQTIIDYDALTPVFSISESVSNNTIIWGDDNCYADYSIVKGEPDKAFEGASRVIEQVYTTGCQEHIYMEPQGVIGLYRDNRITVYGSMQCPYYVKASLVQAFGWDEDRIRVVQTTTGGGFGGKEDFPSILAVHAALAAYKTGKPVKIVLNREEDILVTTKRHPSLIKIRAALKNDEIIAIDADIKLDGGAYAGLSEVVLQRAIFTATGAYTFPNVRVRGAAYATNNVPKGAFRGFGAPQAFFAIEAHMDSIAHSLGVPVLELKKKYLVRQGDKTITGGAYHNPVIMPRLLVKALEISGYEEKYGTFSTGNSNRGIGISLFKHGCGFTGSGERDKIKAKVKLKRLADGGVELLVSSVEMGQGAQTTLPKIVGDVLEIPLEKVVYHNPDTDRVPDSGPTVASRTAMIVGNIVREAALDLKTSEDGEVMRQYRQPSEIVWNQDTFEGDAYPDYSWGVNVVEVEVDPVTFETEVLGIWAVYDIGVPLDEDIARGQMEGGIAQGLGWAGLENMAENKGRIVQKTVTDYIIPTSVDLPEMHVFFIENPTPYGPFGAKGAGEIPLVGAAPALASAVSNALGRPVNFIPLTPEFLEEFVSNREPGL